MKLFVWNNLRVRSVADKHDLRAVVVMAETIEQARSIAAFMWAGMLGPMASEHFEEELSSTTPVVFGPDDVPALIIKRHDGQ